MKIPKISRLTFQIVTVIDIQRYRSSVDSRTTRFSLSSRSDLILRKPQRTNDRRPFWLQKWLVAFQRGGDVASHREWRTFKFPVSLISFANFPLILRGSIPKSYTRWFTNRFVRHLRLHFRRIVIPIDQFLTSRRLWFRSFG